MSRQVRDARRYMGGISDYSIVLDESRILMSAPLLVKLGGTAEFNLRPFAGRRFFVYTEKSKGG